MYAYAVAFAGAEDGELLCLDHPLPFVAGEEVWFEEPRRREEKLMSSQLCRSTKTAKLFATTGKNEFLTSSTRFILELGFTERWTTAASTSLKPLAPMGLN